MFVFRRVALVLGLAAALPATADAAGRIFHVDADGGNDRANGLTPMTAWRTAPGDPAATGIPATTQLRPGDEIRFRGNVAYRGVVQLRAIGTAQAPIRLVGNAWGGRAAFDGSDAQSTPTPCSSAADCGGAANWQGLVKLTVADSNVRAMYDDGGALIEARWPRAPDPRQGDDLNSLRRSPLGDKAMIESGQLRDRELARRARPGSTLLLWVSGNLLVRRPITSVQGDVVFFDATGIRLYDDRDGRYGLASSVDAIAQPGEYAVAAPNLVIARPNVGARRMFVGTGRTALVLAGVQHVVVTGFDFRRQSAAFRAGGEGGAIRISRQSSNITITDNNFTQQVMRNGVGAIGIGPATDVLIQNNRFTDIFYGSGIRTGSTNARISVVGNQFSRIGRTGISFFNVTDGRIANNRMSGFEGVHGNAISTYLANRGVVVEDNLVWASDRPMTFHGDKNEVAPGDNNITIRRNIFMTGKDGQGALISWGAFTRGVTISDNVLVSAQNGLMLSDKDSGVVVTGNAWSNMLVKGQQPPGWRFANNREIPSNLPVPLEGASIQRFCDGARIKRGTRVGGISC